MEKLTSEMDLTSLRVKELSEMCKRLGIRSTGRKSELVERIQQRTAHERQDHSKIRTKRSASTELSNTFGTKKQRVQKKATSKEIDATFNRFQDPDSPDEMTDDGIVAFCEELGITPEDPVVLVISWAMQAETACIYTRKEFHHGMEVLDCVTTDQIKQQLPMLRSKLFSLQDFAQVYAYTFNYSKDPTQKSLSLESALELWRILLPGHFFWLHHWLQFVRENQRNAVSKDVWLQVLQFGHQIHHDLSNFDENGAWPVILDEFVDYMKNEISRRGLDEVMRDEKEGTNDMMIDS